MSVSIDLFDLVFGTRVLMICRALVDERFSPKYIAWSEDGTSIVISNLLGFLSAGESISTLVRDLADTVAGHYVMNTSQKRSAFEKQLSK